MLEKLTLALGTVASVIDDNTGPVPVPEALIGTSVAQAACNTQDPDFGYPDCMPWTVYNGKILFRLSGYEYGRTRAGAACQAMGGWLAMPFSEQDNLDINNFLDAAIGEPNDLVLAGATAGTESWFAPMANVEVVNGVQQLMWFGQQCKGFHLCTHFRDEPSAGFWDDCPDCPQCDSTCPVIPTYTYTGFNPPDSSMPNCMRYKILTDPTVAFGNEYFWNEANCDRKIPALCEIDLKEVGCNAFGVENISSPKWKVDCTTYEHCVDGTIVQETCPPGTLFNQFADPPECQDPSLVEECNVIEPCACTDGVKAAMKKNEKALFKWQMMKPIHMTSTASTWKISSSSAANLDQYQGYLIFSRNTCSQLVLDLLKNKSDFSFYVMDQLAKDSSNPTANYIAFQKAYYRNHADEHKKHRSITLGFNVNKIELDVTGNHKKDSYFLNLVYPKGLPEGVTWQHIYDCLNMAKPVTIPTGPDDIAEHGHNALCDYSSCVGEEVKLGY